MSPQGRTQARRRRTGIIGACCAAIVVAAAVTMAIYETGGEEDRIPPSNPSETVVAEAEVIAARDIGALPSREDFCSGATHCWTWQTAGNQSDLGSGDWTLVKSGTPREAVQTFLPVRDATGWVDFTSEKSAHIDGNPSTYYRQTGKTWDSTRISYTLVYSNMTDLTTTRYGMGCGYLQANGCLFYSTSTTVYFSCQVGANIGNYYSSGNYHKGEYNCVTFVADATDSKLFVNGELADDTVSGSQFGYVDTTTSINCAFGALSNGNGVSWLSLARARIDSTALTIADHQSLCGTFREPPIGTYDQNGIVKCYPWGDNNATCTTYLRIPTTYDGTRVGWPIEISQYNRLTYTGPRQVDCTNWTCGGSASATTGKVDPTNQSGATEITVGSGPTNYIYSNTPVYSASATLYPRVWVKCSSGQLSIHNHHNMLLGDWTIDCSQIGGVWRLVNDINQPFVTQLYAWQSDGSGNASMGFNAATASVTAQIYMPTLTQEIGTGLLTSPTYTGGAVTGHPTWDATNSGAEWKTGSSWGLDATVRPFVGTGVGRILRSRESLSHHAGYSLNFSDVADVMRIGGGSTSWSYSRVTGTDTTNNQWVDVSSCYALGRYHLDQDGVSQGSALGEYSESGAELNIGYAPGSEHFYGIISSFSVWDDCRRPIE